jgi:tRNA dimethylallyltransferase
MVEVMNQQNSKTKVVFVQGATATGKSQLALYLAQVYKGLIINCDSVQVFTDVNIGAAKPSPEEFKQAPHFLYDFITPPHEYTAGEFTRDFFKTLEEQKPEVAFVVGGTGFYFQAIEKGMYPVRKANAELMTAIEQELTEPQGQERLYQELLQQDPAHAQKISPNDHYRLARAIEILRSEKKSITQIQQEFEKNQKPFPYPLLKLGISFEKEKLRSQVEKRTRQMLKLGIIEETESLLKRGFESWAPLQSVGYKETLAYLKGQLALEDLESAIVTSTMQLTKKQRTWFQRDTEISWIPMEELKNPQDTGFKMALQLTQDFLKN